MNYSSDFLAALDAQPNKTVYVKLISLDYNEQPRESIEGRATTGSINIDGTSAIRRSCSISLVTTKLDISDYYWTLKTKFKVQVGLKYEPTDEIIWFDQGIFVISSFSSAYSANNYTVNIQGKDKMCMLNGELGGIINSSARFDSYDEAGNGVTRTIKLPIKQIIRDMVHQYSGEPFHNILVNDLDVTGLELLEYRYDTPLYLLRKAGEPEYTQSTLLPYLPEDDGNKVYLNNLSQYDSLSGFMGEIDSEIITVNGQAYNVAKIDYGETAGYREIDLVYPDDLIANAGDNVTTILSKITTMLGDYEYFYDIDGRFIFQKKQTYLNTAWNPSIENEGERIYVDPYFSATPYSYNFVGSKLFTSFNNTPNLANVKNDFTVWGENEKGNAIHMRYAIDKKPIYYKTITVSDDELIKYNSKYGLNTKGQTSKVYWYHEQPPVEEGVEMIESDWREIIFQMQKDYRKYNHLDNFILKIINANPNHYPTGTTGYEQYYIDIEGFWRYLYTPVNEILEDQQENYYGANTAHPGWNKLVYEAPSELLFWFDFLDSQDSNIEQYSVQAIGLRPKVENSKDVKAIYYGDTPTIIFDDFSDGTLNNNKMGYRYFNIGSQYGEIFSRSTQGKSAKDTIDNLLYNYTYCAESVSIQSIPIYYLQPNTLIYINDIKANIEGDYIINKITIPLTYNGTMSISGVKVVPRLY